MAKTIAATKAATVRKGKAAASRKGRNPPATPHKADPSALTIKQERFCHAFIANSGNASDAYREAYGPKTSKPATVNRTAHELVHTPKIAARIATLRQELSESAKVTVDSLLRELEEARQVGKVYGQCAGMATASMAKAKLVGLDNAGATPPDDARPLRVEIAVTDSRKPAAA